MDDERRGLPSASGIERIALCPGSLKLEQQCPDIESEAATEGTMLHAVLAGERSSEDLTDDQQWVVDRCRELEAQVVDQLDMGDATVSREARLWNDVFEPAYSGKPDVVYATEGVVLCIDYKTGRGEVAPAEENWQMRALAVVTDTNFHSPEVIYVAVIQPRSSTPVTLARYGADDLRRADIEIHRVISQAQGGSPRRVPGERQCRYCRAKGICPEARETALAVIPDSAISVPPALTPEEYADILPKLEMAEKIIEGIRSGAKEFIAAGGAIPGYELKPGVSRREIADSQAAFAAMSDVMTAEEFAALCSVSIGKLEALYGSKAELKGKALKAAFNERLGDAIRTKEGAPSLVKSKAQLPGAAS